MIDQLVEDRLSSFKVRINYHVEHGDLKSASLLYREGLLIAECFDNGDSFFVMPNLPYVYETNEENL